MGPLSMLSMFMPQSNPWQTPPYVPGPTPGAGDTGGGLFSMNPKSMGMLGLASGLLQAGAPSRTPNSFGSALGQGLLGGMNSYQHGVQAQRQEVMMQAQMEEMARKKKIAEALEGLYKPQTPSQTPSNIPPAPGMSANTSIGAFGTPDFATAPQPTQQATNAPAAPRGPTLEQLGPLIAAGVDIRPHLEFWKANNPETKVEGGYAYNPRDLKPGSFLPTQKITDDGKGVVTQIGPNGLPVVAPMAGSLSTYGQFQDVTEASKAGRDPFMGVTDAQGRPIPMTRERFAQTYGGVQPPNTQPASVPMFGLGTLNLSESQADVKGYAPTEADAIARLQRLGRQGQTGAFAVDPSKGGGIGQTAGEKTTQTTVAEGDAKKVLELEAKIPSMLNVNRRLDRMAALTADDKTYAAAGAEIKTTLGSIAQTFGLKVNPQKTANSEEYLAHVAELLKDRLASKDFGSGSGVSNLDILAAQKPLPEMAKTAAGRVQLINALKADTDRNLKDAQSARDYFDANNSLRGFRYPSELAAQQSQKETTVRDLSRDGAQAKPVRLKFNPQTGKIE